MDHLISYTLLTVLTADLLATSGDILMTWTSPVIPELYSNNSDVNPFGTPITKDEEEWIGSLLNIGAMIGPFPFGFIAEKYGRKLSLLIISVPYIISYLMLAFSKHVYLYYIARLLGGLALGGGYTILPMYVAEVSEDSNRGTMTVTLNVFWTFGNLLPYVLGPYMSITLFNIILTCVPVAFLILFWIVAPESPYYLVGKNKEKEAKKALRKLRSNKRDADDEMKSIQAELALNPERSNIMDLFRSKVYLKALSISFALIVLQQLSGINAVLFYTEEIFADAGSSLPPVISSIIIGLVLFFSSFVTPFAVDKLGRKILILISGGGITIAHAVFGVYFYLKRSTNVDLTSISWLPIVSLVFFIIMYNIGVGPVPWTISSELFPTNVKSYASSIVAFGCWTTSFFITRFFENLIQAIGEGVTFWLFAAFCLIITLFTVFFVPETKGKSFQDIQDMLER